MKKHSLLIHGMAFILCLSILYGPDKIQAQKTSLVQVHENVRETPYPQSIHQVYLNPTPLLLPQSAHEKGALYQFEMSMDKTFPVGKTLTGEPKPWITFNPHQILDKGTWYWRYRKITGKDRKAQAWSQVFDFQISGDEPQFITPTYDVFFKNLPKGYPRLYCFLDDDLKKSRPNIAANPEYKEMLRRAQMGLDYQPAANPYPKARLNLSYITYLHTAYTLTGEQLYADKMAAIVRAYLANGVPGAELLRDDFFCGDLIEQLLMTYDACYKMFKPEELKQIESLVFKVAESHHSPMYSGYEETHIFNNHFWQHLFRHILEMGLMFYEDNSTAREMLEYCYELWTSRAPASGFNRDGEWHNGTGYFTANAKTLYYVPSLFSYVTKTDFLKHPWYQNAGQALLYAFPVGTMSAGFGDQNERATTPDRQRLAFSDFLAKELDNPYSAWYATNCQRELRRDFDMRLYRMATSWKTYTASKTLLPSSTKALWYEDIGEVVAHSAIQNTNRNLFLSFRSSPFGSGSHTLADQNSFNLHFRGVPVYRSTGYYLNFSDAHNLMSYRHTRAHNTILVDGIGQPFTTRAYGKITRMLNGENITYAVGDASNAYCGTSEYPMWIENFKKAGITQTPDNGFGETPLTKYRRHILLLHPDIVLIYDELEASKPVTWDWLLHSPVQFKIDNEKRTMTTRYEEKQFTAVAQLFSNQPCEITQTDQFKVAPDPKKMRKEVSYPNQWHLDAKFQPCDKNRILTIIRVTPDGNKEKVISRKGTNTFNCERWKIEAELDPTKPASLRIFNDRNNVTFSLGEGDVDINGTTYKRLEKGSSVLFDKIDGEWLVHEMSDYEPQFTGAGLKK